MAAKEETIMIALGAIVTKMIDMASPPSIILLPKDSASVATLFKGIMKYLIYPLVNIKPTHGGRGEG